MTDLTHINLAHWDAPECPFRIEYAPEVLDRLRTEAVTAFLSNPTGGPEIGGLLVGLHDSERTIVTGAIRIDCEYAFGPSFTLSERDKGKMVQAIVGTRKHPGLEPVGWYHSHTRTDITLSNLDLDIHRRLFSAPWQVALVLRPEASGAVHAGFFYWERTGEIYAATSRSIFLLEPLPGEPVAPHPPEPSAAPETPAPPELVAPAQTAPVAAASHDTPEPEAVVREDDESSAPPADYSSEEEEDHGPRAVPHAHERVPFEHHAAPSGSRLRTLFLYTCVFFLGAIAAATGFYYARNTLPPVHNPEVVASAPPDSIRLVTLEDNGQLQILWDPTHPVVQHSTGASVQITDGEDTQSLDLQPSVLQSGSFTYSRHNERVIIVMKIQRAAGDSLIQSTMYVGKPLSGAGDARALQKEVERLKSALKEETERAQRLERSLRRARPAKSEPAR